MDLNQVDQFMQLTPMVISSKNQTGIDVSLFEQKFSGLTVHFHNFFFGKEH
jgi:hypothetical protein